MQKLRAAVWQYYKKFLPLFIVCIFFSRLLQGLGRGSLGFPFMTPFFFLFVLCTGNTFDRLFLQMQLPRRTQQNAFLCFLPTALLGAGADVCIARILAHSAINPTRVPHIDNEVAYFQEILFNEEIFGGSMARITWLAFLLCTLTLLVLLFAARVLYMLWKITERGTKIGLLIGLGGSVFFLLPIFVLIVLAFDDAVADWSFLEGVCAFFFGSASSALSRFAAKVLQLTVLMLFLRFLQNRGDCKERRKPKSPRSTATLCARIAVFCAAAAFGVWTVYYCTPVPVEHLEYDKEGWESRIKYYYSDTDDFQDIYASYRNPYRPNEKAYRLLETQERVAEAPYRAHIARHMVNQYYSPTKASLPYTDYERGKQYFETAVASNTSYTIFTDSPYSSGYNLNDIQNLYCRYLYEGGEREAALAYYTAQSKAPTLQEKDRIIDWMPHLRMYESSELTAETALQLSGNDTNFLLYLYLQPNGQDAPFAAREIAAFIQPKCTRTDADEGIELFALLWDIAQSDAARTALAEEIADYAVSVTHNVIPYSNDNYAMDILEELRALCKKAGVENRLPKGAMK